MLNNIILHYKTCSNILKGLIYMPLSMVKTGETQTVRKVNGKDDTKKFLETLGIIKGEQLTVLSETGGNVIINVKDSRIALSKSMATRIIV